MSFEVIIGWIIIVFIMHEIQNEYIYIFHDIICHHAKW